MKNKDWVSINGKRFATRAEALLCKKDKVVIAPRKKELLTSIAVSFPTHKDILV